ncbi:MAG: hypothetical protein JSS20_08230 [Proteobacteria bacterium]|nr:hypothetical protein [Pseudomonadota bacterium]
MVPLDLHRASRVLKDLGYVAGGANWVSPLEAAADRLAARVGHVRDALSIEIFEAGANADQSDQLCLAELTGITAAYEAARWRDHRPRRSLLRATVEERGEDAVLILRLLGYERDGVTWRAPDLSRTLHGGDFLAAADAIAEEVASELRHASTPGSLDGSTARMLREALGEYHKARFPRPRLVEAVTAAAE